MDFDHSHMNVRGILAKCSGDAARSSFEPVRQAGQRQQTDFDVASNLEMLVDSLEVLMDY